MATVQRNAQQALGLHKTERASGLTYPLPRPGGDRRGAGVSITALRIECYDISHLQGDDVVASMVVSRTARPQERVPPLQIKGFEGQDDVRSMHEVIGRRFKRYLQEKERTGSGRNSHRRRRPGRRTRPHRPCRRRRRGRRAAGGRRPSQAVRLPAAARRRRRRAAPVAAAKRALDELGIDDIAVCGLAKRLEEVWLPDDDDPVVLPRSSEGLYLLQRVRDEAHRFAITYQRAKRAKRIRTSPLDDVSGLGETRKQALIKHFGSVKKLRQATIDQICEVPGIGRRTAESVAAALASTAPAAPAVNTATGEIIEEDDGGSS